MDLSDFDVQVQNNIRTLLLKHELKEGTPAFGVAIQVIRQGFVHYPGSKRFIYLEEMEPLLRRRKLRVAPASTASAQAYDFPLTLCDRCSA
jgi:hypothetical protein